MIEIRYREDLWLKKIPKGLRKVAEAELNANEAGYGRFYDRSVNGYIVVIEPSDNTADMSELGFHAETDGLNQYPFEVSWQRDFPGGRALIGLAVINNDFSLTIIVPDEPWVDPVLRKNLIDNLEPA